ncbi:IclR family transcriptional regulator [Actinoplanes palleronii]|uniref:IclR family transcriptional regulator n=1 Tax=Actinoplanes palleronii TaxID=113570 RepID=A0ABQ4BC54_9ACTN|nr:IclR family transcriptional regulator [Actinoplanes palleronii]GIE68243.1 IclR family transcriptional regulator [Actinoplanes palleronii]
MPGLIQSIERSSAVLRLLADGPGRLRVKQIADALDLPKSTAQSILRTLTHIGFAEQDPRTARYRLGRALLDLSSTGLDANELRAHTLNWADALASRSGEEVYVGALRAGPAGQGPELLVVHHVFRPDDSAQSMNTGRVLPAHATALGQVLLAYRVAAAEDVLAAGLMAYTRGTVTTRQALTRTLAATRAQGWALSVEEWQAGRAGIAAPVRTFGGLVVGAIGISGPVERLCDTRRQARPALVEHVVAAGRAISRDLSGPQP